MTPRNDRDRDGPGPQRGGERHIFDGTTANPHHHPERTPQLASSNIAYDGRHSQTGLATGRGLVDMGILIHDSGRQPSHYFSEARLIVIGTSDAGGRSKTIDDVIFGVFNLPPEDDLNPSGVPVIPVTPVLEGGAAVRIVEEELTLAG